MYVFFYWLRFFEKIKRRADNLNAPFAYINAGI